MPTGLLPILPDISLLRYCSRHKPRLVEVRGAAEQGFGMSGPREGSGLEGSVLEGSPRPPA